MGDKDRRVEFIQEYTLKSMRLKADKWNKIIIFDEQRQYLQVRKANLSFVLDPQNKMSSNRY